MNVNKRLKSLMLGRGLSVSIWWKNVTAVLTFVRVLMVFKRWVLLLLTVLECVVVEQKLLQCC